MSKPVALHIARTAVLIETYWNVNSCRRLGIEEFQVRINRNILECK